MRAIFSAIFTLLAYFLFAQKETSSLFLGFENENYLNVKLYSFSNIAKDSTCIIAFLNGIGKGFLLANKGEIVQQFAFECTSNNGQVLCGTITDGKIKFLMGKSRSEDNLLLYTITANQKVAKPENIASPLPRNKELISICQLQGSMFFIGVDQEHSKLRFFQLQPNNNFTEKDFDFSMMVGKEYLKGKLSDKLNEPSSMLKIKTTLIDDPNTVPIEVLTCHKKLYIQNNSIVLTIESKHKTDLFLMDLETNEHNYKQVDNECAACLGHDPRYMSFNTFYANNKLFSVTACSDALEVKVIDIYKNAVINNILVHDKDAIVFSNTPVIEDKDYKSFDWEKTKEKEITKTKKILKKMAYGWSVMTVRPDSLQRIELTIGGYLENATTYGDGPIIGQLLGGLIGKTLWEMFTPISMSGNDWANTVHFKSLLDAQSFQHIEGQVNISPEEYFWDYKYEKKLGNISQIMFSQSGSYHYAYVHPKTGMLVFVTFP